MKHVFFRKVSAVAAIATLLAPTTTFALDATASPTTWLKTAFIETNPMNYANSHSSFDFEVIESYYSKLRKTRSSSIGFDVKTRSPMNNLLTSEGTFTFSRLKLDTDEVGMPFSFNEPIGIEWKVTNDFGYVRITSVPASLVEQIKTSMYMDISGVVGKWIQFELPADLRDPMTTQDLVQQLTLEKVLSETGIGSTPIFTNVKKEKSWKDASGTEIIRVTARLNPAIAYKAYTKRIQEVKVMYPVGSLRTMLLKDAYSDYLKARGILRNTYLAANINTKTTSFERIEFSTKMSEPKKECTWNTDFTKETCKTVGTRTYKVKGGISLKNATIEPVSAPIQFMTMQDVEAYFNEQERLRRESYLQETMPEATSSTPQM